MLSSPVKPLSLAPQGTASIFSSMPRSAPCFFLSAPLEEGTIRTSSMAVNTENFMLINTSDRGSPLLYWFGSQPKQLEIRVAGAGLRAARGLEVLSIDFPFAGQSGFGYCLGFGSAIGVLGAVGGGCLVLLNCCADFTKACGFSVSSSCTPG